MQKIAKAESGHFQSGLAECGVRVISDYLALQISRGEEHGRIFELERKLGSRPEFSAVARYIQVIAHHSCALSSEEAGS